MTIDFTKPVQTRDGRAVTILTEERAHSTFPVVGLLNDEHIVTFTSEGKFVFNGREHGMYLVNVPVKHVRKVWLNMYPGYSGTVAHETKESADECAPPNRIACVRVTVEFEEGEGL